jgi:hypothetical protein
MPEGKAMIESLILVEGRILKKETLGISLMNAKQVVIGYSPSFGWILHLAANSPADLNKAMLDISSISGVTNLTTLSMHSPA